MHPHSTTSVFYELVRLSESARKQVLLQLNCVPEAKILSLELERFWSNHCAEL